jgi:hypothetical protein
MRHLASLSLCFVLACGEKPAAAPEPAPVAPTEKVTAPATPSPAPAAKPTAADLPQAEAGGLSFDHTPPLVRRLPKSQMRAAEYGIEGDETAELTVFFFGANMGGDTDANIKRWMEQVTQPDGKDTAKRAVRKQRKVGPTDVTTIEVQGTYSGGMGMPGSTAPVSQENALLLGAIASGPAGPVFFKLVGPKASVERARGAFDDMISSLRVQAPN